MLFLYLRAEGLIALIQALLCSIMLRLLQSPYFLPLALLIGIVDALPVFGSGTILVPWAVIRLLLGDIKMGVGLLLLWGLCTLNRQLLEPQLLGQKLGMSTLLTLFLMYVGYQLFGLFGFILGPVGYLIGKEIYTSLSLQNSQGTDS
jgi:predicted PurR-regulated permease PerM